MRTSSLVAAVRRLIAPLLLLLLRVSAATDGTTTASTYAISVVAAFSGPRQRQTTRRPSWSSSSSPTTTTTTTTTSLSVVPEADCSRRRALLGVWCAATATTILLVNNAPLTVAHAGLLDEYGSDPTKIVDQRAAAAAAKKSSSSSSNSAASTTSVSSALVKTDVQIDPTLRGSYYYPTAKKRYLPRIQKVSNEIGTVPDAIDAADWAAVQEFAKTAENAVLPLQLYQSSLDGQGLSLSNSYARRMKEDAVQYESAYQAFGLAIRQRDGSAARQAVSDMGVAIADYRQQGRLSDADGNIPSVDEMRRMAMRKQTGQYNTYE